MIGRSLSEVVRDWLIDRWATCRRATWPSSGRWTRSTITASLSPCCTRFNNTLPTSRRHCSVNVHVSVLVTCCHLTWVTPLPPPLMFQLLSDWTFRLERRLFITGSIARSASRRYLVYSVADFEVATLCTDGGEIWHGGRDSSVPNFTTIGATTRV